MRASSPRFDRLLIAGRFALAGGAAAFGVTLSTSALAQPPQGTPELKPEAAFERARVYYESARYAACVEGFTHLLERPERLEPRRRASARTYLGACLIARGKVEEARQQFRQAILEDRQLEPPDPVVFPQSVVDLFIQVRSSLMDALQKQQEEELQRSREEAEAQRRREERERWRVAELERLAGLEAVVRQNQRWIAWVPFGVGQFQNDNPTLGWILLSAESALAATAITATSIELGLHSRAEGGRAALDSEDLSNKVSAARQVGTAAWLTLLGVAAGGILEANLSYRSELPIGQRKRTLPDALRPDAPPDAAPHTGPEIQRHPSTNSGSLRLQPIFGAQWVGVSGRF